MEKYSNSEILEAINGLENAYSLHSSGFSNINFSRSLSIVPCDSMMPILGYRQNRCHKKYRVNKKWKKRYGFSPIYDDAKAIIIEDKLYCTKRFADKLRKAVDRA